MSETKNVTYCKSLENAVKSVKDAEIKMYNGMQSDAYRYESETYYIHLIKKENSLTSKKGIFVKVVTKNEYELKPHELDEISDKLLLFCGYNPKYLNIEWDNTRHMICKSYIEL